MPSFADLGLSEPILAALRDVGYESPSPIQVQGIPPLLEGRDVIGQAQTGSGKTAAFGLPMLEYVDPEESTVQGLVLTPTRELCIQVTQAIRTYGSHKGIDVVAVFGGAPIRTQQAQLRAGGHIVVGTVGRVLDLLSRHSLVLHDTRFVVLDEADEMLDLGFLEDVEKILSLTPGSPADGAVQRDDADRDPPPGRALPARAGDREGEGSPAHGGHGGAVLPGGERPRQGRRAGAGDRRRASRPGDRLRADQDPLRAAL